MPPRKSARTGLAILALGAPRVEIGGRALSFDTRKATALLAYLAVTDGPHRRESIAALLWPEHDDEHGRGALRRTLSVVRTGLGGRWLVAEGDDVGLDRAGVRVDVLEFRRALAAGRLADAIALYRGDFLAGFALRDSA